MSSEPDDLCQIVLPAGIVPSGAAALAWLFARPRAGLELMGQHLLLRRADDHEAKAKRARALDELEAFLDRCSILDEESTPPQAAALG
jgi:hypothetical protein